MVSAVSQARDWRERKSDPRRVRKPAERDRVEQDRPPGAARGRPDRLLGPEAAPALILVAMEEVDGVVDADPHRAGRDEHRPDVQGDIGEGHGAEVHRDGHEDRHEGEGARGDRPEEANPCGRPVPGRFGARRPSHRSAEVEHPGDHEEHEDQG